MPVRCEALCWGIPSLRHCLVMLQQMQCSEEFTIPNFIIIIFCFVFLLCCTVIEVYARWVWSFMLRYPFLKALLNHITTDAMFQIFIIPNFLIVIFCFGFLLCCAVIEVYASWVWSFVLMYPFFKALLSHITTDAMFQSIYHSKCHNHYFLCWLFAVLYCDWDICQ